MVVRVVTDSTSDLPPQVADELAITVVPAQVQFGTEIYRDGVDLSFSEFYRKLEEGPILPKTSPPSPGDFTAVYQRLSQEADAIVSVHVAAKLSATCDAARLAAAGTECPVCVVDSQSASMACGLLAIIAAKAAKQGASMEEVEELVKDAVPRTITYGMFDTLEYLYRGGRIGRAQAFLGAVLKIRPILAIRGGEIVPVERVRTRPRAIDRLCSIVQEGGAAEELSVMDSTSPEDAENLVERLSSYFPAERMYRAKIGPVMGTYVGPRSLGLAVTWQQPR